MSIGFIILRHVNSVNVSGYWKASYESIREHYPESPILIIDDNSKSELIDKEFESKLYKTTIIQSEYPGRGELLPYLYYLKNPFCDTACIIHDSVFMNKCIDLQVINYSIIWDFEHGWDQIEDETRILKIFENTEILNFHKDKRKWTGCFGGMSVITHKYLSLINEKYDMFKLVPLILNRYNRMSFERVIACLLQSQDTTKVLLGNVHKYSPFGKNIRNRNLPMTKFWSGR